MSLSDAEPKFWEVSEKMQHFLKTRLQFIAMGAGGSGLLWAYLFLMGVQYSTAATGPYMMVLFPFVIFLFIPCLWSLLRAWHKMRSTAEEIFPSYMEGVIAAFILLALLSAAPWVLSQAFA